MALSMLEANARLGEVTTKEGLRDLVNQLDIHATGGVTVLYGGSVGTGVSATSVVTGMLENGENIRVLDETQAAKFLDYVENEPFREALERIIGSDPRQDGRNGLPQSTANKFVFGDVDADGKRVPNGAWDNISGRFVDATVGEVRTLVGGAAADRVFVQTEVQHVLQNTGITHVDGIPLGDLKNLSPEQASKAIIAQSDGLAAYLKIATDGAGVPLIDNNGPRLDARDFFSAIPGGIEGKPPLLELPMAPMGRFIPLRFEAHKEGVAILQNITTKYKTLLQLAGAENQTVRTVARGALNGMGYVPDLLALGVMVSEASAAQARGDAAGAQSKINEWLAVSEGGIGGAALSIECASPLLGSIAAIPGWGPPVAAGLTLVVAGVGGFGGSAALKAIFVELGLIVQTVTEADVFTKETFANGTVHYHLLTADPAKIYPYRNVLNLRDIATGGQISSTSNLTPPTDMYTTAPDANGTVTHVDVYADFSMHKIVNSANGALIGNEEIIYTDGTRSVINYAPEGTGAVIRESTETLNNNGVPGSVLVVDDKRVDVIIQMNLNGQRQVASVSTIEDSYFKNPAAIALAMQGSGLTSEQIFGAASATGATITTSTGAIQLTSGALTGGNFVATSLDANNNPTEIYIIERGNTLNGLAAKYNVTPDYLVSLNLQITDRNKIYAGAGLIVPVAISGNSGVGNNSVLLITPELAAANAADLARLTGSSIDALTSGNIGLDFNNLNVGGVINLSGITQSDFSLNPSSGAVTPNSGVHINIDNFFNVGDSFDSSFNVPPPTAPDAGGFHLDIPPGSLDFGYAPNASVPFLANPFDKQDQVHTQLVAEGKYGYTLFSHLVDGYGVDHYTYSGAYYIDASGNHQSLSGANFSSGREYTDAELTSNLRSAIVTAYHAGSFSIDTLINYFGFTPINGINNFLPGDVFGAGSDAQLTIDNFWAGLDGGSSSYIDSAEACVSAPSNCYTLIDPIVIDLDHNGFNITSAATSNVYFDVDNDGFYEKTAWFSSATNRDGVLAIDLNGNGRIDGVYELVSEYFNAAPGKGTSFRNGFDVLSYFDQAAQGGNNDGKIDANDRVFENLSVWKDNGDGVGTWDELLKFKSLGATLSITASKATVQAVSTSYNGSLMTYAGSINDGTTVKYNIGQFFFQASSSGVGFSNVLAGGGHLVANEVGDTAYIGDATANTVDFTALGVSTADGLAGNDVLIGGAGNDTLIGSAGADTLHGGAGDDRLFADADDLLSGSVRGGDGFDTLMVDAVTDVSINMSQLEVESVLSGKGNDFINGNASHSVYIQANDGDDYVLGGHANDIINGGSGDDYVFGGDGTDELLGGTGNDTLVGGTGADLMKGGAGDDVFYVDDVADTITELLNEGADAVFSSVTHELAANVENLSLTGAAAINGTGNALDNILTGNSAANVLAGGAGNDTYVIDLLDTVVESSGGGTDTVQIASTYSLETVANIENITLTGFSAINATGNALNNVLTGNSAANVLTGGAGDDTYVIDLLDTVVENSGGGTDTIQIASTYSLETVANVENLTLLGTAAINATGNALNNVLTGNSAANVLTGGEGNDTYVVGTGDTVIENANEGVDTVQSSVDFILGNDIENLTLTGSLAINGTGNALANMLIGNSAANELRGGDGNDIYVMGVGDTVVENANEGWDTIQTDQTYSLATVNNVENLTLTGDAAINATGNILANILVGNSAANVLTGGAGDDTYVIGAGDTVIENTSEGLDTIQSDQTYSLASDVNVENLTLTGTANIDGTGNAFNNVLIGNAGNNTLYGDAGTDTLLGGLGDDTYVVDSTSDVIIENANEGVDTVRISGTYVLGDNLENLTLTGINTITATGNALDNVITDSTSGHENGGNGEWKNVLAGGAGNDTYVVTGYDKVVENANEGIDTIVSSDQMSLFYSANVENLTLTGTANINGTGNYFDNLLIGNDGRNILDGGAGADTLQGGLGDDTYIVDLLDVVTEAVNAGTDTIQSAQTYSLASIANVENLTLTGSANIDGTGDAFSNVIAGNDGNNTLDGGGGGDTLKGRNGDDIYVVNNTGLTVIENASEGTDTVLSSISYSLGSNVENITLTGSAAITATGNALANILVGNSAANVLTGGDGNDTYVADLLDTITEAANAGVDTVQIDQSYSLASLVNVENLTLTGTAAINGTGNALDNVLAGNSAANVLAGGAGNDTYIVDLLDTVIENANEGVDTVQSALTYSLAAIANVENLTLTGTVAINGTGNALNNVLTGNSAANVLAGGAGNDTYIVDLLDTVIENANEGVDTVQSALTYSLAAIANVENLALTGTANINGTGNSLDNLLIGNDGDNILDGAAGADTLQGGLGNDIYIVDLLDVVTEAASAGTDTIQSAQTYSLTAVANIENLTLTGNANIDGTGDALINTIMGNDGDNTLNGGGGADTLKGGKGNDIYVVGNTGVVVDEDINNGVDTVLSSVSFTLGYDIENITLTGSAAVNATGNNLGNVIIGNSAANVLKGWGGNDTYIVGAGDTVVEEKNNGTDTVQSGITWTLSDYVENLTLTGSAAINGTGNTLDNILVGNSAANVLAGGSGYDTYIVSTGDTVTENANAGIDSVQSDVTFTLGANVENLTLTGAAVINGTGNTLANVLRGNSAANTLTGAAGNDTYQFGRGGAADTIVDTDSTAGNADLLLLDSGIAYDQLWFKHVGTSLEVSVIGTSDKVTINNWYNGAGNHVEKVQVADGHYLVDTKVEALVQAMAGMTAPPTGQLTLSTAQHQQLDTVLAANWSA